jgi:cytochrome o ubiquinol oxidase subunit II
MDSRCDTGRIATISIPDGGSGVPTAVAAAPIPDRSKTVRPDHAVTWRSSDSGSRRHPVGRRAEYSTLQSAAYPPRHSGRPRWPVVLGPLLLASCSPAGILDPQGPIATAERLLLINSTVIMLVVVVPVVAAALAFAWWYRAANPRAVRGLDPAYEGRIEFVTWSIPALIVILLGGVIWIGSHQLDPKAPIPAETAPLRVDVVALDWKWLFIYPDQGVAAVNQLVVPAGTPVSFRLTSATVMNSFFIPQLGSQIYTMGGMTTHLNLLADRPGEYPGFSANYSGAGFAEMRFVTRAVPPADFDAWVGEARAGGRALDAAGYAELAKPSRAVPPASYGAVAPGLFQRIVDETLAGPETVPAQPARSANTGQGHMRHGGQ